MAGMQDERWEFDLDLPRSEANYQVRCYEVVGPRWFPKRYLDRLVRIRLGPPRPGW
jgi:hypothetical protein